MKTTFNPIDSMVADVKPVRRLGPSSVRAVCCQPKRSYQVNAKLRGESSRLTLTPTSSGKSWWMAAC